MWDGFNWLRIGFSGVTTVTNLWVPKKKQGNPLLGGPISASQLLCPIETDTLIL